MSDGGFNCGVDHSRPPGNLARVVTNINNHLREHQSRSEEECRAVMGGVKEELKGLIEEHLRPDADPERVSEICLFLVMFVGQEFLECEFASLVFEDGDSLAASLPVFKLCALLPLPRFAHLQSQLVDHLTLLAAHWLPRYISAAIRFLEETVDLLTDLQMLWLAAKERGTDAVFTTGTWVMAYCGLAKELEEDPLKLPFLSTQHLSLGRAGATSISARVAAAIPSVSCGTLVYTRLWNLLCKQLGGDLCPDEGTVHKASLEAALVLLENDEPPDGITQRFALLCLGMASQALLGTQLDQRGRNGGDQNRLKGKSSHLQHLTTIQELLSRCIDRLFSCPGQGLSTRPDLMASLFTALSSHDVVAHWWSTCGVQRLRWCIELQQGQGQVPGPGARTGRQTTTVSPSVESRRGHAEVALARSMVGAYASAVEGCSVWSLAGVSASVTSCEGGEGNSRRLYTEQ
ncbi:unnamed protein product, partial [Choristocarpus tenellus]